MSYPSNLTDAYTALLKSALVCTGDNNTKALIEFTQQLSAAQVGVNNDMYKTVQALYTANPRGYIACIRNTPNQATVLWTDARAIVTWFNLSRSVYIKHKTGSWRVYAVISEKTASRKPDDLEFAGFPVIRGDEIVLLSPSLS